MAVKRKAGVGRWTYERVAAFYTRARRRARCGVCGSNVNISVGKHPRGLTGRPAKIVGANLKALKEWIRDGGWRCAKCKAESLKQEVVIATPPYPAKFRLDFWEREYPEWTETQGTGWISEEDWNKGGWSGYEGREPLGPGSRGYPKKKWKVVVKYPKVRTAAAARARESGPEGVGESQEVKPDLDGLTEEVAALDDVWELLPGGK